MSKIIGERLNSLVSLLQYKATFWPLFFISMWLLCTLCLIERILSLKTKEDNNIINLKRVPSSTAQSFSMTKCHCRTWTFLLSHWSYCLIGLIVQWLYDLELFIVLTSSQSFLLLSCSQALTASFSMESHLQTAGFCWKAKPKNIHWQSDFSSQILMRSQQFQLYSNQEISQNSPSSEWSIIPTVNPAIQPSSTFVLVGRSR